MEIFKTSASIQAAATHYPDAEVRHLLSARIESLFDLLDEFPLSDLMHVIVLEPGDTAQSLEAALSLPIFTNGLGLDVSDPAFVPGWEVCEAHAHWYEITFVLSSDGFGMVVYVPKTCTDATLLALCERFAQAPHRLVSTSQTIKDPYAT
jgi:hypothetical protein